MTRSCRRTRVGIAARAPPPVASDTPTASPTERTLRHHTGLIDQKLGGDIIYIASKNSVFAGPDNIAYSATKAAQPQQVRLLTPARTCTSSAGRPDRLLCQLVADRVGVPVVAGPVEATAIGNVLLRARTGRRRPRDLEALRANLADAVLIDRYEPRSMTRGARLEHSSARKA